MEDTLQKTVKFVNDSFGGKKAHYVQTLHWLFVLKPDASLALQIAAYGHDVERAFKKDKGDRMRLMYEKPEQLTEHQEKSAAIMYDFIIHEFADSSLADSVKEIISKHEIGGTDDQNLLKDADSLSYLEVNAPRHVGHLGEVPGSEMRDKFRWMYERISSKKAKELAAPYYEKALNLLEEALRNII
ncbi:MAG: DUF4202 family protein [Patescibacteria group bacterium]|jgi:hypothetical protein